jgi:photosystem II stability/assembly factor-like uncharacterized protein
MRHLVVVLTLAFAAGAVVADDARPVAHADFRDPLDTAAPANRLAVSTQLGAVARAGNRLVAVGVRGLILVSDDAGQNWKQVTSPVSSDLVSVRFLNPQLGWATGHDGVVLASQDGGSTWVKQLDGRMGEKLLLAHFEPMAAKGDANAVRLLEEIKRNYGSGPELPILDVWFETPLKGWAVGGFGTIFATRDGGKTWESWFEKVDNDKMFHYNAIRGIGGEIYMASEQGTVFRLDRARERFVPLSTGYRGSYFGFVGNGDYVLAFGLRGSAYRSRDKGQTWTRLDTGVPSGLTAGTLLDDGRLLLVSQDGRLLASANEGDTFTVLPVSRPTLFTDVVQAGPGRVALTGLAGVQTATFH